MSGYEAGFLDVEVELPVTQQPVIHLDYTHFSVLLDPVRRLAAATAVNIAGAELVEVKRGSTWRLDARAAQEEQAGAELYARNDLDRGHLVRRRDPVWGEDAKQANSDTFVYTNAAPQAAKFNQSKELWVGLEDHVLAFAGANRLRLSVFTGPVFRPDDALYRGVRIPRMFWKIAAWTVLVDGTTQLRSAGFVVDQSPLLEDIDLRELLSGNPPPLGPFRTFQVPVERIAELTALSIDQLEDADRYRPAPAAQAGGTRGDWHELAATDDIEL
ncbi:MAG: DNA/RNA non-specific endonuclease [Rhodoglobus sp.]